MKNNEVQRMTISLGKNMYDKIIAAAPDNISAWVRRAIQKALDVKKNRR